MASKGMDVAAPFKSDLQTSQESSFKPSARPTTQPHVRYGQHAGIAEVDRDTGHANGKTQASQNSVLSYHRKDLSAPSAVSDAQALNPTQSSQVAQLAKSSLFRPATSGYQHGATRTDDWSHGDVAGQQESTSPSAGGRGTQDESCTANASQTGHAQGGSSQSMETKTDLPLSRLSSTWIADSLPGNGRERMGTPKGGSSHDPVSSRPSSSLRPEPPSYNGMQSLPGGGHRAAAAFAISGLGISPDGRPTTQVRGTGSQVPAWLAWICPLLERFGVWSWQGGAASFESCCWCQPLNGIHTRRVSFPRGAARSVMLPSASSLAMGNARALRKEGSSCREQVPGVRASTLACSVLTLQVSFAALACPRARLTVGVAAGSSCRRIAWEAAQVTTPVASTGG